jgi:hypothetical protein
MQSPNIGSKYVPSKHFVDNDFLVKVVNDVSANELVINWLKEFSELFVIPFIPVFFIINKSPLPSVSDFLAPPVPPLVVYAKSKHEGVSLVAPVHKHMPLIHTPFLLQL